MIDFSIRLEYISLGKWRKVRLARKGWSTRVFQKWLIENILKNLKNTIQNIEFSRQV